MLYRKMYLECAVVTVALVVVPELYILAHRALGLGVPGGGLFFTAVISVAAGFVGNGLYLRGGGEAVRGPRLEPAYLRDQALAARGGTSGWALVLGLIGQLGLV